jgi:hypothetical protein
MEDKRLQRLAPLQLAKHIVEGGPQLLRVQRVENLPHPRIARHLIDEKHPLHVLVQAALLKCQQRGILEREQGQARHQGIGQRNVRIPPRVGNLFEPLPQQRQQSICRQSLARLDNKV